MTNKEIIQISKSKPKKSQSCVPLSTKKGGVCFDVALVAKKSVARSSLAPQPKSHTYTPAASASATTGGVSVPSFLTIIFPLHTTLVNTDAEATGKSTARGAPSY